MEGLVKEEVRMRWEMGDAKLAKGVVEKYGQPRSLGSESRISSASTSCNVLSLSVTTWFFPAIQRVNFGSV